MNIHDRIPNISLERLVAIYLLFLLATMAWIIGFTDYWEEFQEAAAGMSTTELASFVLIHTALYIGPLILLLLGLIGYHYWSEGKLMNINDGDSSG